MANTTVNQTQILQALANLMGHANPPGGNQDDWKRFAQESLNYAWRYYKWGWTISRATIDLTADPAYLPEDFDLDGWHKVADAPNQVWQYVPIDEYDELSTGQRYYTIEFDHTANRYKFVTSFTAESVDIVYQVAPPALTINNVEQTINFPSAHTLGMGAAVIAKQEDNPGGADISQEWDQFHLQLDRLVGRSEVNKPRRLSRTRQDVAGTYTGDVGVY